MSRFLRKFISPVSFLLVSFIFLTSCQKGMFGQPSSSTREVLFVIHSAAGHFQLQPGNETQGQLILNGVNETVAFFKDQENQEAGSRNLSEFLSNWNQEPNAFSDHPPSAAFVYHRSDSKGSNPTFEQINLQINHPQYNASTDEVIFDFQLIGEPVYLPMGQLNETTLFIDGKVRQGERLIFPQKNSSQS